VGLTDAPKQQNLTDVYPEGTAFWVEKAWVEGVVQTQFGDRTMAKALIASTEGGQVVEFALWGSLCEQVQQIEDGDLPGYYKVAKEGKRWLFAVAEAPAAGEPTTDEAGLGLTPEAGEGQEAGQEAAAGN
jgi:hypothetical protein